MIYLLYGFDNNCSTGSTGLQLGRTMIAGGMADAVLVVGFEKMFPGSLQSFFNDRANPTGTSAEMMKATRGVTNAPGAPQMFGNAGREYKEKFGAKKDPIKSGRDADSMLVLEFASIADAVMVKVAMDDLFWELGNMGRGFLPDPCSRPLQSLLSGQGAEQSEQIEQLTSEVAQIKTKVGL